jgi:DNA-binding transcriptional MocR family regulator
MYSTKTATTNNQEFNSSYMPVGINENVTLKEVNVNKTPNGRDFLEIIFENENGQTATMTLAKAVEKKVAYVPGTYFCVDGGHLNTIRLNFSNSSIEQIEYGMNALSSIIQDEM